MQIDNLNELPSEKRPNDYLIWDADSEELESWLDKVISGKKDTKATFVINEGEFG
jgi:hypothetical protein